MHWRWILSILAASLLLSSGAWAAPSASLLLPDDPKEDRPPELKFQSTDPDKAKEPSKENGKKGSAKKSEKKEQKKDEKKSDKREQKTEGTKSDKKENNTDDKKADKATEKKNDKKAEKKDEKKDDKHSEKQDRKPEKSEPFYYEYNVEEGDSLELIASMYGVSAERIRRWNKSVVPRKGAIKAGTTLRVYAQSPIRVKRKATYETQKGDNLKKIARKLKTNERDLRTLNKLKSSKLQPGMTLVYLTSSQWPASESVGKCSGGKLVNGEKLPAGPGYSYGSRPNVYGTNESVTLLLDLFGKFRKKYPRGPALVVGNLSRNTGGALSPHKSHQSGRDVDLGYVIKKEYQPVTHMINANEKNLDCEKTWFLMETLIKTGKIKYMFVDTSVQKLLYDYLVQKRYPKKKLKKYFQYPDGGSDVLIKHIAGHLHHVHVRFVCPRSDKECQD